jgi:N-acyl-D-amino-acid deacylase
VPSRVADLEEVGSLLEAVRDSGKGVIALLPGETVKHADVFDLQRRAQRPVTWTALLTVKGYPWHVKIMEANHAARAEGVQVWPQVSCRPLTFQMNLREPFTFNMRSTFQELMDRPVEERMKAYRDPAWRTRAYDELSGRIGALPVNFDALAVAESSTHPELIGRKVVELAEERGATPLDVMLDMSLDEELETRFTSVLANNDPDAIAELLPDDTVLLGLADSGAHVSQLCDACFATDFLGNWVRDKEVMPLEQAIFKLTGEPADVFGLSDRGTLEVGKAADVVVFDFDQVAPGPLRRIRDFPADGERLVADKPEGVRHVLVNGTAIREDGEPVADAVASRPGTLLRS